ncbi:MAG: T9SS type A sorting domain-containing protein [Bacteroidales bacterium]|nr:T9SS type A sorting domain-containing protein [Bacteroidales bacterium]
MQAFTGLNSSITFRFYVYGNNTGGTDPTRRAIIDNVVLIADISGSNLKSAEIAKEAYNHEIMVYPNPVSGEVLKVDGLPEGAIVSAYSVTGVKLFEKQATSLQMEIQTADLPTGAIIISIEQDNRSVFNKLIIK